jgi:hypothetical protein
MLAGCGVAASTLYSRVLKRRIISQLIRESQRHNQMFIVLPGVPQTCEGPWVYHDGINAE